MRETASLSAQVPPSVLTTMYEARAAAKRLGVDAVQYVGGQWRPVTLRPTEKRRRRLDALRAECTADQRLRLARARVSHANEGATAARRRRLTALVAELNADRRARLQHLEAEIGGRR